MQSSPAAPLVLCMHSHNVTAVVQAHPHCAAPEASGQHVRCLQELSRQVVSLMAPQLASTLSQVQALLHPTPFLPCPADIYFTAAVAGSPLSKPPS